jgi:hypothetical protein
MRTFSSRLPKVMITCTVNYSEALFESKLGYVRGAGSNSSSLARPHRCSGNSNNQQLVSLFCEAVVLITSAILLEA